MKRRNELSEWDVITDPLREHYMRPHRSEMFKVTMNAMFIEKSELMGPPS